MWRSYRNSQRLSLFLTGSLALVLLLGGLVPHALRGMEIVGSLDLPNRTGVVVRDTIAYIVGSTNLKIFSIARPASPDFLGQLDLGMVLQSVDVEGNYAYCAGSALAVVDISDPRAPDLVHTVPLSGPFLDLAVEDTILTVGTGTTVLILGLRNPSLPRFLVSYAHATSSVALHWPTRRIYAGGTNGVIELDISDPAHPIRDSHFGAGQAIAPVGYSYPYVIAAQSASLLVLDPSPLGQVGTFGASAAIRAVCEAGGYQSIIGLADGTVSHLRETEMPPELVASVNVGAEVRRIDVEKVGSDTLAVVATASGITIVRFDPVSDAEPYRPQLNPGAFQISAYPNPFNRSVRLQLNGATNGWHVLELFNLTGRKVITERIFLAGEREFAFEPGSLGTGVYFVRIMGASGTAWARLVYLK